MNNKIIPLLILALFCVFLIGCGGGKAQITGKVAFEDGSPLTKGSLRAKTGDGIQVKGIVKEDGTFTLYDLKPGDGIPSGKQYRIWVVNAVEMIPSTQQVFDADLGKNVPAPPTERPLVAREFTDSEKSPITLDVPKGSPKITHDITVKKP